MAERYSFGLIIEPDLIGLADLNLNAVKSCHYFEAIENSMNFIQQKQNFEVVTISADNR